MSYPAGMLESVRKVEASRKNRISESFPRFEFADKTALLQAYHPDFRLDEKRTIAIGPNKGDTAPKELVALLESPSRVDQDAIDLSHVDYTTDVLVIGGGGDRQGVRCVRATRDKIEIGRFKHHYGRGWNWGSNAAGGFPGYPLH
jgi:hypothetical protein